MKNLTYDQLIELAPKDRPFQIEVEFIDIAHPIPRIEKIIYWAFYDVKRTEPFVVMDCYRLFQEDYTKKRYTLIDPQYQKPEVLKVGQKVRVMESARECGDYDEWFDSKKDTIGTIGKIEFVKDYYDVLGYTIEGYDYPHYCVMPVEEEEVQEIPALENTLEQLDNLVSKAQDIISKYKK
jgi:hypothetical protein